MSKLFMNLLLGLFTVQFYTVCATAGADFTRLNSVGTANWSHIDGQVQASSGSGFLVTADSYENFVLKLEFKAGSGTNSGIFFRCQSTTEINDRNCYEVNIFDTRPDQTYRTGAITGHASPKVKIDSEDGKWHSYEVHVQGERIRVILDGRETVLLRSTQHLAGPIALQFAQGQIAFRNLEITITETKPKRSAIEGVWELTSFTMTDAEGRISEWCPGSYGIIIYTEDYMSTAVNCSSDPKKLLLYSGPFIISGRTVTHDARNFSDPSLNKLFSRSIVMNNKNHLRLSGLLPNGSTATVEWKRR